MLRRREWVAWKPRNSRPRSTRCFCQGSCCPIPHTATARCGIRKTRAVETSWRSSRGGTLASASRA
jgi:hypothetical protein